MSRRIISACLGIMFLFATGSKAGTPDEGMWLPLLIKRLNYDQMKKLGCNLTPEEIYSVNNSSIKDAIVQLGSFCTAEVVSPKGLLLTNHHCAFDAIASQSSVENDFLTDGFWAKSNTDELPIEGLSVSFLVKMEDVTQRILDKIKAGEDADRDAIVGEEIAAIEAEASEGTDYRVEVKDMFMGNEFYLFVYEVFHDIRLVGAPPSAIGKFGGDTDNWMWPRHTGDFSMLRIYAGTDNSPAEYSEENIPYRPKHFLPVSIKEKKEGDFAMIMGYPGTTDRYLTSDAIDQIYDNDNPERVKLMGAKLKIMKADMDADDATRIAMASSYASTSNYYKYCLGQNNSLSKRGLDTELEMVEGKFSKWVNADPSRKGEYGEVVQKIKENIETSESVQKLNNYINFAGFGSDMVSYGVQMFRLHRTMSAKPDEPEAWAGQLDAIRAGMDKHFDEEFFVNTDQKVFATMTRFYHNDLDKEYWPEAFSGKTFTKSKAKGDMDKFDMYAQTIYSKSMLTDKGRLTDFLDKPSVKALEKDPGVEYVLGIIGVYIGKLQAGIGQFRGNDESLMRDYIRGTREMNTNKAYYPDANFTMRLTYGTVIPYIPRDGVKYQSFTTTDGILEKEVKDDLEFHVPEAMLDLIRDRKFGQYADGNGDLRVNFLTNNDITGGNSGSPVINGDGELIGIAFDGNWESMTSDLVFDDDVVRTISVDIRYVLWVIDKYAGASHLVDEMKVIK